jgi:hypothetical protein
MKKNSLRSKPAPTSVVEPKPAPTETEIQHAAYLLWLEAGRPEGRDVDHWLAAKQLLCHRHGRDAHTGRPAVEIAPPAATRVSGRN